MNYRQYSASLSIFEAICITILFSVGSEFCSLLCSAISNQQKSIFITRILEMAILIGYMLYMIKKGQFEKEQFQVKKMSISIILLGYFVILSYGMLPIPKLSLYDKVTIEIFGTYFMGKTFIYGFILSCIAAPIIEELFFRGIILRGLLGRYSSTIAIAISSLLFGICHTTDIIYPTIIGLFLGWINFKTQNILYCIFMHSLINFTSLIARHFTEKANEGLFIYSLSTIWFQITCGILSVIGVIILYFIFKRKKDEIY